MVSISRTEKALGPDILNTDIAERPGTVESAKIVSFINVSGVHRIEKIAVCFCLF